MASEFRTLTAAELAALEPRVLDLTDAIGEYEASRARSHALQKSWILGLAVANGAALTALSGKMLDALAKVPDENTLAAFSIAFPSLWCFASGFVFVGVAALQEMLQVQRQIRQSHSAIRVLQQNPASRGADVLNQVGWKEWAAELMAGAAFITGLTYPLVVLTLRYFEHGGFAW